MNKDITQKILSIIANFNLSEVEQINELEILYKKQEEEIERLEEDIEYSNHCEEQLRKTITNLKYKIDKLEEKLENQKETLDSDEDVIKNQDLEIERLNEDIESRKKEIDYWRIQYSNLQEEIERLKEENKKYNKWIESLNKDNHRLHSIIKEVREILESKKHCERLFGGIEGKTFIEQALKILDKGE